jgi:hypothetical protein
MRSSETRHHRRDGQLTGIYVMSETALWGIVLLLALALGLAFAVGLALTVGLGAVVP